MNVIVSIKVGGDKWTSTYTVAEYDGEQYILFATTDAGAVAALKLDPDQIAELPIELGAPASHFYKGNLTLDDIVVIPKKA